MRPIAVNLYERRVVPQQVTLAKFPFKDTEFPEHYSCWFGMITEIANKCAYLEAVERDQFTGSERKSD